MLFLRIVKSAKARRIMTNSSVSQNLTETSRTDVKQAITLMWISVLYVVCQSPKIVPDFYEALHCEYSSVRLNDSAVNDTLRGKIKHIRKFS